MASPLSINRAQSHILLLALLAFALPAFAEDTPATAPLAEMETVTVTGQAEDKLTGSNSLNRSTLDNLPARNGSLNEAIGILPGVQLGEYSRTSDNAGEILPPNISISGGRFYENNFIVDGMGNNSLLDPAYDNTSDLSRVPGHPQEFFLHPSLVESISVYRSNIPAKFGSFTGGVVDVQTRDPSGRWGGQINLRHTRSEWTELHIADEREGEFDNPVNGKVQPDFRKYDSSFSMDVPLTENSGVLIAASRIYSKIPLVLVDDTENQYRTLDNYFLKYAAQLSPQNRLTLSGNYTPYDAELFLPETIDSDYTINNEAYSFSAKLSSELKSSTLEFNLGYRKSTNNREAAANYFAWQATPSKSWGNITDADVTNKSNRVSKEGGYGDLEQSQNTWAANVNISMDPVQTLKVSHVVEFGASYEQVDGKYERDENLTYYSGICGIYSKASACNPATTAAIVQCRPGDIDCIKNEQFFYQKTVYPADSTDTTIRFYDVYLEDTMTWGGLSFRPGLRFSYDDLQKNKNWAPRLAGSYDFFGDGETVLIGGINRYYGKTLLTHALAEEHAPTQFWKRDNKALGPGNIPKDWTLSPKTVFPATRLADLKTPYTDEWTVGIDQKLFGGVASLSYIERKGRDELFSKILAKDADGYVYTEWTNDGESWHQEATLSWERTWQNHYILITTTWQETETSNSSYDDIINSVDKNKDGIIDPVYYNGQVYDREDLPRPDFNREWTAAFTYIGRLPYNFTFTNVTRYRSGYTALVNTGKDTLPIPPTDKPLDIYDEIKQPESWVFDWVIEWEKVIRDEQSLIFALEINNVFDEKVTSGESIDVYDLGRQFWLGLSYKF